MTNRNRTLRILLAALALLAVLALPAFAEGEKGEANITPQTTMKELRENPSIKGSGLYTYVYVWERDCGIFAEQQGQRHPAAGHRQAVGQQLRGRDEFHHRDLQRGHADHL